MEEVHQDAGSTTDRLLAVVRGLALELHPHRREVEHAGLDARLERDFGIDSLARVELTLRIERTFDLRLPEELVTAAETPSELVRAIAAAGTALPETELAAPAPPPASLSEVTPKSARVEIRASNRPRRSSTCSSSTPRDTPTDPTSTCSPAAARRR